MPALRSLDPPTHRPFHVGLTGNIASGKSTVVRQLIALGATVIDADTLAREVVAPGLPAFDAVIEHFGPQVVASDGTLDRAALRQRVFHDPIARTTLNSIIHPEVGRLRDRLFADATQRGDALVISDVPLLFEVGLEDTFDGVLFVDAPAVLRRERLIRDRALPASDADAMIASQWESEKKRPRATWVIDNDGTRAQLEARVAAWWHTIRTLVAARQHAARPSS
ncbi:MAG: dephospho-CoA kinase [Gemmatimonadaceae bacterium]|nr:dephospho-CoA kinase [Gemmatimonadaceae bacterium]